MQKVMVTLPEDLLKAVDTFTHQEKLNRSQLIRKALTELIKRKEKEAFHRLLAQGYEEMAKENLRDAEAYLGAFKDLDKEP